MDVALPPLLIEKLPSGLTLLAVQRRGLPLFHARLSVPAGACEDPRGKAGLAQFTVDLLRRGTRRRPAQDVDDLIETMGAQLSTEVSMEEAALALTVPAELAERALDALLEVALEPAFEESEVSSARRRSVAALQSDLDEPSTVAGRAVVTLGYGPTHPYAHPAHGFRRDVETFRREDALGFHATRYQQEFSVDAHVYFGWRMDPGIFEISLKLNPGVDPARAEGSLWAELSRLCDEPLPERELERAKNLVRSQLLRGLQTTNGRAHTLGQMELMLGSWRAFLDLPDRYAALTAADLQRVARKTFAHHRRNVVTLIPGEI